MTSDGFLAQVRSEFVKSIRAKQKTVFVIEKKGRVVGEFEYAPTSKLKIASLGLNLSAQIQGQGLAKLIYYTLLSEMERRGIREFVGGTSQPGVLRLAKVMNRKCLRVAVRSEKKPYFKYGYFAHWLNSLSI